MTDIEVFYDASIGEIVIHKNGGGDFPLVARLEVGDGDFAEEYIDKIGHLLAAAPKMLEALERVAPYLAALQQDGVYEGKHLREVSEGARAAIAKAKGGQ